LQMLYQLKLREIFYLFGPKLTNSLHFKRLDRWDLSLYSKFNN
jgi:hypothetical protein